MSRRFAVGPLVAGGLMVLTLTGPASAQLFQRPGSASDGDACKPAFGSSLARLLRPCPRVKRSSHRPLCHPCALQHFGYYHTCWAAWPFQPDYAHCPCGPAPMVPNGTPPTMPPTMQGAMHKATPKPVPPATISKATPKPAPPAPRAATRPVGHLFVR